MKATHTRSAVKYHKFAGFFIGTALTSGVLLVSSHSFAKEKAFAIEEVVTTAQKREESMQEVPVSVAVLTAQDIKMKGYSQVSDMTMSIPNVGYQNRGGSFSSFSIRGISTNVRNIGVEDSTGVYVDGVYIGRSAFFNLDLGDVKQIEVLRGPQGTLYGKNTTAGALNITTADPKDEFGGKVNVTVGNFDYRRVAASVSIPVSQKAHILISGVSRDRDGYIKNLADNRKFQGLDEKGARIKLNLDPSDNLSIKLTGDYSTRRNSTSAAQILVKEGRLVSFIKDAQLADYVQDKDGPVFDNQDIKGGSATVNYNLANGFELVGILAYRDMKFSAGFDDDGTPIPASHSIFDDKAKQFSTELRLVSPSDKAFDYQIGLFYYNLKLTSTRNTQISAAGQSGVITGNGFSNTRSYAIYAQGNYHITDRFTVTGGARWTKDKKEAEWNQNGFPVVGIFDTAYPYEQNSYSQVSPSLSLTYLLDDDVTTYAKVSRGFKGGGFVTDIISDDSVPFSFDPETLTSYEVGFKSMLLDNRLRLNLAAFYMDYKNLQVSQLVPGSAGFSVLNAGAATIKGFEAEMLWRMTEDLSVSGGLGYTHAIYDKFKSCGGTVDAPLNCDGNVLRNAPKWTANVGADYYIPVGTIGDVVLHGDIAYRSRVYWSSTQDENLASDGFLLANARLSLVDAENKWTVALYGKNLTKKHYTTFKRFFTAFQETVGNVGEPRTYGIEGSFHF